MTTIEDATFHVQGPARVRWVRRGRHVRYLPEGAVSALGSWGSPWRIKVTAGIKPFLVYWAGCGLGRARPRPDWWQYSSHATRREAQETVLAAIELWLDEPDQADLVARIRTELAGQVLWCHCGKSTPCHADVLVKVANSQPLPVISN
jgi:hypothetical protein